jgi:hypothetical protein
MPRISRLQSHRIPLALLAGGLLACGGDEQTVDPALDRDLSMAIQAEAPEPALQDGPETPPPAVQAPRQETQRPPVVRTPAASQPQRPAPQQPPVQPATTPVQAPAPAPATAPTSGFIAAGSTVDLAINSRACTSARPGDKFTARLTEAAAGTNGAIIPAGAIALIEIAAVDGPAEQGRMVFRVRSITVGDRTYPATGRAVPLDELEVVRTDAKGSDAKKVVGGAIAGAIIGQMIGKDTRGTVVGAAAGAAAGTAVARSTAESEGCLLQNGRLRLTFTEPVEVALG